MRIVPVYLLPFTFYLPGSARADPELFAPPLGQIDTKARGQAVETAWAVDRTAIPEGEAFTATLTVRGATNPAEVVRPDLRQVKAFVDRFEVEDVPGPAPPADAKELAFVYRLKPRNRSVNRLPSLDFPYRKAGVTAGNPYMNARARGIDLAVTAAVTKPAPPPVPLAEPDRLFAVVPSDPTPFAPGVWAWLLAGLAGPLVAGGWYAGWRWKYPGAARAARLRRAKAARRAGRAITRAARTADPPATIAAAVLGYLRARYPLPPGTDTPAEVGEAVRAAGLPDDPAAEVEAFLRDCDAARFGGVGDGGLSLDAEAVALLARLEAVE